MSKIDQCHVHSLIILFHILALFHKLWNVQVQQIIQIKWYADIRECVLDQTVVLIPGALNLHTE